MNFYPHHIGDYLTATAHLTWQEDCAYRRLLDVYYSREQALPTEIAQACRLVRAVSKDERKAVETVLTEFFTLTESGWGHSRCELEIEKAKVASARSKANGMKGGRPTKQKPSDNPAGTQQVISRLATETQSEPDPKAPITKTITNTNTSVPDGTDGDAVKSPSDLTKAELWTAGKSLLRTAGMPEAQCGSFVGKLCKDYDDALVIDAVREAVVHQPADPASFLKSTCQRLAGQRPSKSTGKHAGFEKLNYREGVQADGSLA